MNRVYKTASKTIPTGLFIPAAKWKRANYSRFFSFSPRIPLSYLIIAYCPDIIIGLNLIYFSYSPTTRELYRKECVYNTVVLAQVERPYTRSFLRVYRFAQVVGSLPSRFSSRAAHPETCASRIDRRARIQVMNEARAKSRRGNFTPPRARSRTRADKSSYRRCGWRRY